MKKLYFMAIAIFLVLNLSAQDTTDVRLVAVTSSSQLLFFYPDTTDMYFMPVGNSTDVGHAIFTDPATDSVFVFLRESIDETSRDIYTIQPFTGASSLVYDVTTEYINSADITPDGRIFGITGNGNAEPGKVVEINIDAATEDSIATFNITPGLAWAMEYSPDSNALYVFAANDASVPGSGVHVFNLTTNVETFYTSVFENAEIHGAYYNQENGEFLLSDYYGELWTIQDGTFDGDSLYISTSPSMMDIVEIDLIVGDDNTGYCPNAEEPFTLYATYESNSYQWYKDGQPLIDSTSASIQVIAPGTYQVLCEIGTEVPALYMFSEETVVEEYTVPNVNLSAPQSYVCPGVPLTLTGSFGGTSQWYLNNVAIVGANSNTYEATVAGSYNMSKTNTNGCTSSSATDLVITDGTVEQCNVTNIIEQEASGISIYPNPTSNLVTISNEMGIINQISVYNVNGSLVTSQEVNNSEYILDVTNYASGLYTVIISNDNNNVTERIIVE